MVTLNCRFASSTKV
uniref:Uncharacterized protein n=1 Tax=Anguilla anguilla TaxID=7936 RepID=A0A0E9PN19_ANGAN